MPAIEEGINKESGNNNVKNKTCKGVKQVNPCNRGKVTNNESGDL